VTVGLKEIVEITRNYAGLTRKGPIAEVFRDLVLEGVKGPQLPNYGDDAAVIPQDGGYLLLATDGIMTGLLVNEPYAAGKASVMVTVNDIYAMGGRPLAMVNVLASGDEEQRAQIVAGIKKGCTKLNVPMVGGHLHPDAPAQHPALSVAILGQARQLMRSHLARPGDALVVAMDLQGRAGCKSVVSWDANSGKTTKELLDRLEVLPHIAESGWVQACKDISNAGLLGTTAIMMENSGCGAAVDLDSIPAPPGLQLKDWLLCFQSYGFILAVPPTHIQEVLDSFEQRAVAAAVFGRVEPSPLVKVMMAGQQKTLFDFSRDEITGITYRP
jgi:hypothetical protein